MFYLLLLVLVCGLTRADYDCLCSYNVERAVFISSLNSSQKIGFMYEFDCKPTLNETGLDTTRWQVVAFEHRKGYIQLNAQIQIQICPGDPSPTDILTTQPPTVQPTSKINPTASQTSTTLFASSSTSPSNTLLSSTTISTTIIKQSSTPLSITHGQTTLSSAFRSTTAKTPPSIKSTSVGSSTKQATSRHTRTTSSTQPTTKTTATTLSTTFTPTIQTTASSTKSTTASTHKTTSSTKVTTIQKTTTTTPRPTTTSTTRKPTTAPLTIKTTTQRTTSIQQPATVPMMLGNTSLCPSSVVQYAQQDGEIVSQMGHSCYTVVPHKYSWSHAESDCNKRGGHLFHVKDAGENLFIYILLNTHFNHTVWMGLHDQNQEEHFQWTSGDPVTYINWMPGRKSFWHYFENCAEFVPYKNHGQWDDVLCGGTGPVSETFLKTNCYICQFAIQTPSSMAHTQSGVHQCPRTFFQAMFSGGYLEYHNNRCYERFSHRKTWDEAERDCVQKGGHLVHIGSLQEETFIRQLLSRIDSQHAVWIGLNDQGHEEKFTWTSGEPLTYTNWMPGRYSNFFYNSAENCVALIPYKNGMWDDIPCGEFYINHGSRYEHHEETHPYICEYAAISVGSPAFVGK